MSHFQGSIFFSKFALGFSGAFVFIFVYSLDHLSLFVIERLLLGTLCTYYKTQMHIKQSHQTPSEVIIIMTIFISNPIINHCNYGHFYFKPPYNIYGFEAIMIMTLFIPAPLIYHHNQLFKALAI